MCCDSDDFHLLPRDVHRAVFLGEGKGGGEGGQSAFICQQACKCPKIVI